MGWVNATQMAKAFEKRPIDWLSLPSTKEFLDELTITEKKSLNVEYQAVITKKSGSNLKNRALGYTIKTKGGVFNTPPPLFLLKSNFFNIDMGGFPTDRVYINGVVLGCIRIDFKPIDT